MSSNISVLFRTFNRFKFLLNAIESVRNQTYKDFEIIVVNDGSSDLNYYNHPWTSDITIIHLPENTRQMFKFASANYVRNIGIQNSSGKYIAFLDDDDIWLPHKLEYQIKAIETTGCSMSCTEAYIGKGVFHLIKNTLIIFLKNLLKMLRVFSINKVLILLIMDILLFGIKTF